MTNLFPINPIITTSQKKNIIYNTSFFINDINFLRLYLSVFNIVDHIMEKNKYHQVIINHKSELSPITIQIQNIFQNLDIKIAKSTLFHFYNIIKLSF